MHADESPRTRPIEPGNGLPKLVSPQIEYPWWADLEHPDDIRLYTLKNLAYLIAGTTIQVPDQLAESYRGFNVGASVLALDHRSRRSIIVHAGNYKPNEEYLTECAELRALSELFTLVLDESELRALKLDEQFDPADLELLAISVVGPEFEDPITGIHSSTCKPCFRCRIRFDELLDTGGNQRGLTDETLIVTANLDASQMELNTTRTLQNYFNSRGRVEEFPKDYHPLLEFIWANVVRWRKQEKQDIEDIETLKAIHAELGAR
jgi:hypothetical protein